MTTRKIIGTIFSIIAVLFSTLAILKSNLKIDLKEYFDFSFKPYFSLSFFNEVMPLIICLILLYGSLLLIIKPTKSNPLLALFGVTVLEDIVLSWLDITTIIFPISVVAIFFCCAALALWIAYSDRINQKKLSLREGVSSLITGTLITSFSFYFYFYF